MVISKFSRRDALIALASTASVFATPSLNEVIASEKHEIISEYYRDILSSIITNANVNKGKEILESKIWQIGTYPTINLTPEIWKKKLKLERTHLWLLHQHKFITELIAYDRQYKKNLGASLAIRMVNSWWAIYGNGHSGDVKMSWHDHGTALRLGNLFLLRAHLADIGQTSDFPNLDEICLFHAELLATEDFHTAHNNHGLDQSLVLFQAAFELSTPRFATIATERVTDHLKRSFTSEGGHVENSAAYQEYGVVQAVRTAEIGRYYLGDNSNLGLSEDVLSAATLALGFMTRPNGTLVPVGDTGAKKTKINFGRAKPDAFPQFEYIISSGKKGAAPDSTDIVLSDSGWAIFRETWEAAKFNLATHVAFKCGFVSYGHRHDDDLSLTLFAHGEEWLADGGMYKYEEKDPIRIYCRSAQAHSLPQPVGVDASRVISERGEMTARITEWGKDENRSWVSGISPMFPGYVMQRRIEYDRTDNSITITDSGRATSEKAKQMLAEKSSKGNWTFLTRFLIPGDKKIFRSNDIVTIMGASKNLKILSNLPTRVTTGQENPMSGWISPDLREFVPAHELVFLSKAEDLSSTFKLTWA